jgi:hypothetical protein
MTWKGAESLLSQSTSNLPVSHYPLNVVPSVNNTRGNNTCIECVMVFLKRERERTRRKRGEERKAKIASPELQRAERANLKRVHHNPQTAVRIGPRMPSSPDMWSSPFPK